MEGAVAGASSPMLVFHPPGESHAEKHDSDVATLNVELDGSWLRRVTESVAPLEQPVEFAGDIVVTSGLQLLQEFKRNDTDSALAIESLT